LLPYARPEAPRLLLVSVLMLIGVFLDLLKPWPLKLIVDHVLVQAPLPAWAAGLAALPGAGAPTSQLVWLAAATVGLFVAAQLLAAMQNYVQAGASTRMTYHLAGALYDHMQRLSLRYHSCHKSGDLVRRVTVDSGCVRDLYIGVGMQLLTSVTSLVLMFAVMWRLDPLLSLVALFVAPLLLLLIRLFDRPMTERGYAYQQLEGEMMALAEQTLTSLPVVQAFNREEYEDRRFRELTHNTLAAYLRSILAQTQFGVGVGSVTAVGTAVMMAVGGMQVLSGSLTVGTLLVFLTYLAALYAPLENIAYLAATYAAAVASGRRVLEVMAAEDSVHDTPCARPLLAKARGHVRLEGVTFGYEEGRSTLRQVDLEARPGETVAIVGATGAGKSTLMSLIPRFYDPWAGRITLDGVDVRAIQLASLREQVAVLLQEPFLLPLSVADNIAYGRPGAIRAEIEQAAAAAQADEFICRLPQGYDTVIGERGATLSGGQRQRLAIARALLKDAPVLILDEPTAALDAETEASLMVALARLTAGRTTLIIAHRLSTIAQADKIIVFAEGSKVEEGTHQQLLARRGAYYCMVDNQRRADAPFNGRGFGSAPAYGD
jgi:ATP-binding cassette subfamily B protein/subfamily B ATP-binding cassette protein MsbA